MLIFVRKRSGSIASPDIVILFLFILLGIFSYYTSGSSIIFVLLALAVLSIIRRGKARLSNNKGFWYIILIACLIYFSFDYIFFRYLRDLARMGFVESLIDIVIYRRVQVLDEQLAYSVVYPDWLSMILRISTYLVLLLTVTFIITTVIKALLGYNVSTPQFIIASSFISSYAVSAYYTFLMSSLYIRYYLFLQIPLLILILSSLKRAVTKLVRVIVCGTIIFTAISGMCNLVYTLSNSDRHLTAYTNYLSNAEYEALCRFIVSETSYPLLADLKTAYSLPVKCDVSVYAKSFKHRYFEYYSSTHNVLSKIERGVYLYTVNYMRSPIFLLHWRHYKPFIVSDRLFDGLLYNTGSTFLWLYN